MSKLINQKEAPFVYWIAHLVGWGFPILVVAKLWYSHELGISFAGTCSMQFYNKGTDYKFSTTIIYYLVSAVIIVILGFFTLFVTSQALPKTTHKALIMREEFLAFYYDYVVTLIVYYTLSVFSTLVPATVVSFDKTGMAMIPVIFARIGNVFKALLPIVLFCVRTKDPAIDYEINRITKKIQKFFGICCKDLEPENDDQIPVEKDSQIISQKRLLNVNTESNDVMWFNVIGKELRYNIIRTIINFVGTVYGKVILSEEEKTLQDIEDLEKITITNSRKYEVFDIKGKSFMKAYEILDQILDCNVTVFFSKDFSDQFDDLQLDRNIFKKSWNKDNCIKILKKIINDEKKNNAKDGEGGASGELFVMSLNKKFILKTVSYEEGKQFDKLVDDMGYFNHVNIQNNTSIMPKFFGYFEFCFTKLYNKKQYVIIMENITPIKSEAIIRKYDLKGSTVGREVNKEALNTTPSEVNENNKKVSVEDTLDFKIISGTLKDIDWKKLEKDGMMIKNDDECINPKEEIFKKQLMLESISNDVEYLKKSNVMDYSLIVAKVN